MLFKKAFNGVLIAMGLFVFVLVATLWFDNYSVLYWVMDTRYAVLYVSAAGAIVGVSFSFVAKTIQKLKSARLQSGLFRLRLIRILSLPTLHVKRIREGK